MPAHNRVYLADKDLRIYGYSLSLNVVEYQTAILRGDMDAAAEILPTLPKDQLNKVARFLESKGTSFRFLPILLLLTKRNRSQRTGHRGNNRP